MTDTEAGTPPREARNALLRTLQDEGIVGRKRQRIEDAADRFATATLVAARSRPATDPAGLDVERLADAITNVRRRGAGPGWDEMYDHGLRAVGELLIGPGRDMIAAEYARLAVADGPGPATCICGANPPRRPWTPGANGDPCRDGNGNFREGHGYVADGPGPDIEVLMDGDTPVGVAAHSIEGVEALLSVADGPGPTDD